MYKPNLQLPLASSYNERGVQGFTNAVTNRIDQQKINCMYEITKNSMTGTGKLDLTKRPGVTQQGNIFGVSSQAAYLISIPPTAGLLLNNVPWVFSTLGNDLRASDSSGTSVIFSSAAAYFPCFIDKTLISSKENIVVQFRKVDFSASQRVFYSDSAVASFTEIVDADFTALIHRGKMEQMDGFAFVLDSKNNIYNSDLNSLANWTATNFIAKQIKQDFPQGLAKLNNQIIGFGDETMEVFYNAGNATGSPLSPIKQLFHRVGLIQTSLSKGTHYYCIVNDKMYFVGRRAGGIRSVGLFAYNGNSVEKVSTTAIDKILGEAGHWSITAMGFHGKVAIAIALNAPPISSWLMFFPEWNDWFEWGSSIFQPVNASEYFLGGTGNTHRIYSFGGNDNWQDDGTNFTMQTQFKLPQDGQQRKRMAEFGVLGDTARSTNMLSVEFSDDDYVSFVNIGAIDLARDIKTLNRGGSYRQRAVRLSSTNALETRLSAFIARIE